MPFQPGNAAGRKTTDYVQRRYDRDTPEERAEYVELYHNDPETFPQVTTPPTLFPAGTYKSQAQTIVDNWGKFQGLSSGYDSLDKLTLGFMPGELILLGAPTNHGKTQLALNIAYRMASQGTNVLYISQEQTQAEMEARLMKIHQDDITGLPIWFPDHRLGVEEIIAHVEALKQLDPETPLFIIVDHIHKFHRGANMTEAIAHLSDVFQNLAKDYQLPILLLSQFNRLHHKSDAGPKLEHLKESGYLEQDADVVLLAWRETPTDLAIRYAKGRRASAHDLDKTKITLHDVGGGELIEPTITTTPFPGVSR